MENKKESVSKKITRAPKEFCSKVYEAIGVLAEKFGIPESKYKNSMPKIFFSKNKGIAEYHPDKNRLFFNAEKYESNPNSIYEEVAHFLRARYVKSKDYSEEENLEQHKTVHEFFGALGRLIMDKPVKESDEDHSKKFSEIKKKSDEFLNDKQKQVEEQISKLDEQIKIQETKRDEIAKKIENSKNLTPEEKEDLNYERREYDSNIYRLETAKMSSQLLLTNISTMGLSTELLALSKKVHDKGYKLANKYGKKMLKDIPNLMHLSDEEVLKLADKYEKKSED